MILTGLVGYSDWAMAVNEPKQVKQQMQSVFINKEYFI
jgi:hypothetical protein